MTISVATVDCRRVYLFQNSIFSDRHVHSNFVVFRPWLLCDTAQPARLGWFEKTKHQQRAKRRGQTIPTRLIEAAGPTRLLQGARMTLLEKCRSSFSDLRNGAKVTWISTGQSACEWGAASQMVWTWLSLPANFRKKFRSQTSDKLTDKTKQQTWEESEKRKGEELRLEEQKSEESRCRCAKNRNVTKHANHCVFAMFRGPGGSTSTPAKAAGAEPSGKMGDQKLHEIVSKNTSRPEQFWHWGCRKSASPHEAHLEKHVKNTSVSDTFGS